MSVSTPVETRVVKVSQSTKGVDVSKIMASIPSLTDGQKKRLRSFNRVHKPTGGLMGVVVDFAYDKESGVLVCEVVPRWEREDQGEYHRKGRSYPYTIFPDGSKTDPWSSHGKVSLDSVSIRRFPKMIVSPDIIPFGTWVEDRKTTTDETTDDEVTTEV